MNFFQKLFGLTKKETVTQRRDQPDVYHISSEASAMKWAMEKARLTLQYFKTSLQNPSPNQVYFSLKARIVDGRETEHIWLSDISFDDVDIFYGVIGNAPLSIKNVSLGMKVGVDLDSVSDWMIIENGRLIGGYTIRCLRDTMAEKDQRAFDKSVGFHIDEGVDYFEHNLLTPEGAILSIEDGYDARDLARVLACKDFSAEAKLMLSQSKKIDSLSSNSEIVIETARTLKLAFIKLLDEQGFPTFKNVLRAFPKREFINNDLCIVTEICQYPDHTKSIERLYVGCEHGEWKVLSPAD